MTENTSTGRQDNSKASWFLKTALDQSKVLRNAPNYMEQSKRAFEASRFLLNVDYSEVEVRVLAAYSEEDTAFVIGVHKSLMEKELSLMETIADQETWEPRLTCGKCGFRSATTDMFMAHCDSVHKVITNRA